MFSCEFHLISKIFTIVWLNCLDFHFRLRPKTGIWIFDLPRTFLTLALTVLCSQGKDNQFSGLLPLIRLYESSNSCYMDRLEEMKSQDNRILETGRETGGPGERCRWSGKSALVYCLFLRFMTLCWFGRVEGKPLDCLLVVYFTCSMLGNMIDWRPLK